MLHTESRTIQYCRTASSASYVDHVEQARMHKQFLSTLRYYAVTLTSIRSISCTVFKSISCTVNNKYVRYTVNLTSLFDKNG
jgi:hypothetical protein